MFRYLRETDIDQYYKDVVGETCDFCKSPIAINETNKLIRCINPNCQRKIAGSIDTIVTKLGITGIGISACLQIVRSCNYEKITDFLRKPPANLDTAVEQYVKAQSNFSEVVSSLCIGGMKAKFATLTEKYYNMAELDKAITEHPNNVWGVFEDTFGYGNDCNNMLELFYEYCDDLYEVDSIFPCLKGSAKDIIVYTGRTIKICITESINSEIVRKAEHCNPSKDRFVKILNDLFAKKGFIFKKMESVSGNTDYVVSDGAGGTIKEIEGRKRGILISSDELLVKYLTICKNM